jgi:radical SAM protein with 4Fe4S-binding SPASM domain
MRVRWRSDAVLTKVAHAVRMLYHWQLRRSTVLPYHPNEIDFEITNRCNFKCSFCPQSDPEHFNRVPATTITPEQATIILRKLRAGGLRTSIIHWTLDGEPFMHKRFHDVLAAAAAHGFDTHHFATNGYFVTPERLRQFPHRGQRYFLTPDFCSDEGFFETHRGTKGSWRVVLNNIRSCLADPTLGHVHFKITDISSYKIGDPAELERRFAALKRLFPESRRVTFGRRVFHNSTGYLPIAAEKLRERARYHLCPYPWFSFTIASNGDVVACCRDLEHKTILGNLFRQEFEDIWNGEKYQALRRDLAEKRPDRQRACVDCDMPYDVAKFSARNIAKTVVHRLLIFEPRVDDTGEPSARP